jgi:hypothetical protein
LVNGTWTNVAQGANFTPGQAQVGRQLRVVTTYTDAFGTAESVTSAPTAAVSAVNNAPVVSGAVTLAASAEDTVRIITAAELLANATDADSGALTVVNLAASSGTLVPNGNGTWTFRPRANDEGSVTFRYLVSDGGRSTPATATLDLTPVNDAPVVSGAATLAASAEDTVRLITTAELLVTSTDPERAPLTVVGLTASSGTLVDNLNGTWTFTPALNDDTSVTFSYQVSDGALATPATATLDLTPVNDAPTGTLLLSATLPAENQLLVVSQGTLADADGLGAISFQWQSSSDGTTWADVAGATGAAFTTGAAQAGLQLRVVASYVDLGGTLESVFSVATAPVAIGNRAPVATADIATTNEDTAVTIDVLANDTDPEGNLLAVVAASAANGTVDLNFDGTLNYTPNADFNGSDTITYTIDDGAGGTTDGTVEVTVNPVNDAPIANDDTAVTTADRAITIAVLANDVDIDGDTLSVTAASAANGTVVVNANGTVTYTPNGVFIGTDTISYTIVDAAGVTANATVIVTVNPGNRPPVATNDTAATNEDTAVTINVLANDTDVDGNALTVTAAKATNGSVVINGDGTLSYTPNANFNGPDTISYTIDDGFGGTASATVAVTVNPVNDAPVANADTAVTNEDTAITVNVLANDTDVELNTLTVTTAKAANGTVVVNANGTLTYTPNANFNGSDTITYSIGDGAGGTASATVAVTVNPVNDAPVATSDTAVTGEDNAVTINVLANDTDVDGNTLTVTAAKATNGSVVIDAKGTLTYTPNANFNGSDTISYSIADGAGGTASAAVAVTVNPVNDAPVANADTAVTNEDTAVTIDVRVNDTDVDLNTLTVTAAKSANGTVVVNANGTLAYTPNANFNGSDTITYTIDDGAGGTASATVAVTVNPVNDAPTSISPLTGTVAENAAGAAIAALTVADPDNGDTHTFTVSDARFEVAGGVLKLVAGASLDFETQPTVALSITATDQGGLSTAPQSFTVNVTDVVEAPAALNLVGTAAGDTLVGGAGADTIQGLGGDDSLRGLAGNDEIFGDAGVDRISGGDDDDSLDGGAGRDSLFGEAGNDTLLGGIDDDVLQGGAGLDRLDGGYGRDSLTGGADSDIFVYRSGYGLDTVYDFQNGTDRIDLSSMGLTFNNLVLLQSGYNVIVWFNAADQLTLRYSAPITLAQMDAGDFIF